MENAPTISIVMGVYNCENSLAKCIESLLNQTYQDWELIMCDDGSQDSTVEIANQYARTCPEKIRLLVNPRNLTLAPTLNRCLQHARGKYIARQDGDDISLPDRFEQQIKFMEQHPEYDLVGSSMILFDDDGEYGKRILVSAIDPRDLMKGSPFVHPSIMIKKEALTSLGGYSECQSRHLVEDYDLWFRFYAAGFRGYNLSQPLYRYRRDRDSYQRNKYRRRINEVSVMLNGRKLLGLPSYYNLRVLKPLLAALITVNILSKYHRRQLTSS